MNYRVVDNDLQIRSGPGLNNPLISDDPDDWLNTGDVVIGADVPVTDPAWLPILLADNTTGWVARQYVMPIQTDYKAQEVAKTTQPVVMPVVLPIMQNQLRQLYGNPREGAPYLTIIDLTEFAGQVGLVRDYEGKPWSWRIYGHKALEVPLKNAFRLLVGRNLASELKTYDGCFNIRPMKSGRSPSVHSWGLAIDLNAGTNPFQEDGSEELITDFSDDFVSCFAKSGFEWGGLWTSCHDAMHFQLPWIEDWRQSSNPLRPRL